MQFQVMTGVPVTPVTAMCAVVTVYAIVAVGPVDGVTTQFGGLRYGAANVIVGVAADAVQLPEKSPIGAAGGEQFDSESDVGPAPAGCPWIVGFISRKPVCAYAAADASNNAPIPMPAAFFFHVSFGIFILAPMLCRYTKLATPWRRRP